LGRALVTAFCGTLVWWSCYLPYDETAVLRAIPADVAFVSVHDNLGARWPDVCGSQLVRCLALSAGVKTQDVVEAASDPEIIKWIRKLAGMQAAIAYTPSLSGTGREAWLISSWIGGYSQRLRWMASLGLIKDAVPVGMCGRQRIWTAPIAGLPGNKKLSVAVSEGVLMCCISAVSNGVSVMVEAFDRIGRSRPGISSEELSQEASILHDCRVPDRGWVAYGRDWPSFSLEFDSLRGSNSWGRIRVRDVLQSGVPPLKIGDLERLGTFLGDTPEIVTLFRASHALQVLGMHGVPPEAKLFADIVKRCSGDKGDPRMFMCLFGGKYRARIKSILPDELGDLLGGIPVPVVMCGIEVDDADAARQMATGLLDYLNAGCKLGIIARAIPVLSETVVAIEGTGQGDYSSFKAEERVAYTVCGRWLILSSNVEILSKLVVRYQADETKVQAMSGRWLKGLMRENAATVYAWSDLDAAGVTLKDSMALYKLSMKSDSTPEIRRLRHTLNFAMEWMDSIRQLNCGSIAASTDGTITELRFVQGTPGQDK
ncbi:MAG: hypothetical protein WCN95_11235, partial [bacterium]